MQSLIAIGSGGPFGLGLGQSRQKFLYLPEPFNDFIFSVVCEELGFIGATLILGLFAFFVYRGFSIARRAGSRFGAFLATGITMQFAFDFAESRRCHRSVSGNRRIASDVQLRRHGACHADAGNRYFTQYFKKHSAIQKTMMRRKGVA